MTVRHDGGLPPWFRIPEPFPGLDHVAIIGAGIAGAALAFAFAAKGVRVTLFEQRRDPASGASGNPAAAIYPLLSRGNDPVSGFSQHAYRAVLARIRQFQEAGILDWHATGVFQKPVTPRLKRLVSDLGGHEMARVLDDREAEEVTGFRNIGTGIFYPTGGFLNPRDLYQAYVNRQEIEVVCNCRITTLEHGDTGWRLLDENGHSIAGSRVVVLATGPDACSFSQTARLPLLPRRGQLALIDPAFFRRRPKTVICHEGYLIPDVSGDILIGATWNDTPLASALDAGDHHDLLTMTNRNLPDLGLNHQAPVRGRSALRTQTPDHLPLVGPLYDDQAFRQAYSELHHGRPGVAWPSGPVFPGLYVSLGHGARGMVSSLLCAEMVAAQVLGLPLPLPDHFIPVLHPARFLMRTLKKKPDDRLSEERG